MEVQTLNAGCSIRTLRKFAEMTLDEVASTADISVSYLSQVETGKFVPTKGYVALVTMVIVDHLRSAA